MNTERIHRLGPSTCWRLADCCSQQQFCILEDAGIPCKSYKNGSEGGSLAKYKNASDLMLQPAKTERPCSCPSRTGAEAGTRSSPRLQLRPLTPNQACAPGAGSGASLCSPLGQDLRSQKPLGGSCLAVAWPPDESSCGAATSSSLKSSRTCDCTASGGFSTSSRGVPALSLSTAASRSWSRSHADSLKFPRQRR
jgi:hypothetical protein